MDIRLANKGDLPAIQTLLQAYAKFTITPKHLNHRDISIVAYDDNGVCVGFLWCGLMAGNTKGYIDKFCVNKSYTRKGVGKLLAHRALKECLKRGVKEVEGIIRQDESHDKCAMNSLAMAIGADKFSYTYVSAQIEHILTELKLDKV